MVALTQVAKKLATPSTSPKKVLVQTRGYGFARPVIGKAVVNPSIMPKKVLSQTRGYGTNLTTRARQITTAKAFYWG